MVMIMAQLTTKLSEVQICKQPLILNNWVESMQHEQGLTAEQAKDVRSALGRAINTDHLIPKESIKMEGHKITCIEGVSIVEGKLYVNGSPFIPDNCGAILPGGISSVSKYYVEPTVTEDEFFRYNNTQIRSAQVALQEAIRKAGTI